MAVAHKFLVAAFAVLSLFSLVSGAAHNITSPPVTDWGEWGRMERCPFGRYAQGFQLKTEPNQFFSDDTALNAIRLFCGDPHRPDTAVITSTEGDFGNWGQVFTCFPGVLNGFQLRVEGNQGDSDDTATNNIRFFCSDLPNPNDYIEGDGLFYGNWGESQHCHSGNAICGIQTQVEPDRGTNIDDTALNNVRFECCDKNLNQAINPNPNEKYLTVKDLNLFDGLNSRQQAQAHAVSQLANKEYKS